MCEVLERYIDEANINNTISNYLELNISDEILIAKLAKSFDLSKEDALEKIEEFKKENKNKN